MIGNYEAVLKSGIRYYFTKIFGCADYHTQIRLKRIRTLAKKRYFLNRTILEIGCGRGIIAFEISFFGLKKYVGVDRDEKAISVANELTNKLETTNITFHCDDAFHVVDTWKYVEKIDTILLIDFLEHIDDPLKFLKTLDLICGPGCEYIVQVPTPAYKRVFGEKFNRDVGHVKDGYSEDELNALFDQIDKRPQFIEYNTGIIGNMGARLFYNNSTLNDPLWIKYLLLLPFTFIDINKKSISSELFVIYK